MRLCRALFASRYAPVGDHRDDAGRARDDRDDRQAADHLAEPAGRMPLVLQPQLLGLGQLASLIQFVLTCSLPALPLGVRPPLCWPPENRSPVRSRRRIPRPTRHWGLLLAHWRRSADRDCGRGWPARRATAGRCPTGGGRSADCASSSTQPRSRSQPRIRLSCDRSRTVRSPSSTSDPASGT